MTEISATADRGGWPGRRGGEILPVSQPVDTRRALQLALAGLWLLDAVLQYQSFMFTKAFGAMLGASGPGNPWFIAQPISWNATLVEQHSVLLNSVFATCQLLLAFGIAWRPLVRAALAASVVWSLAVWWLGEGLGGVLGATNPVNDAPGAVILYALLAVLLWPADRGAARPPAFTAARAVGARLARVLWSVLWLSLAYFALLPANRSPQGLPDLIAGMASGEPDWLAAIDRQAAAFLAQQGLLTSVVLAAVFVLIAVAGWLPGPANRAILVLAIAVAVVIWVIGQGFGEIFTGTATDPNTGPLLVLLALAYWPVKAASGSAGQLARSGERAA
jgi:hypothetical protein